MNEENTTSERQSRPKADRWDRRYRVEGDPLEALKVVLAAVSGKNL